MVGDNSMAYGMHIEGKTICLNAVSK